MKREKKTTTKKNLTVSFIMMIAAFALCATMVFAWFTNTLTPGVGGSNAGADAENIKGIMEVFEESGDEPLRLLSMGPEPGHWKTYRIEMYNIDEDPIRVALYADQFSFAYPASYTADAIQAGPYYNKADGQKYTADITAAQFNQFVSPVTNATGYIGFRLEDGEIYEDKKAQARQELLSNLNKGQTKNYVTKNLGRGQEQPAYALSEVAGLPASGIELQPGTESDQNRQTFYLMFYFSPNYYSSAVIRPFNIEVRNSNPFMNQKCNFRLILNQIY